jgi:hypothetical protein
MLELVERWLLARLVETYMEATNLPLTENIYDKLIYATCLYLERLEGVANPFRKYTFAYSEYGPCLVKPSIQSLVAELEIAGLVETALELIPLDELVEDLELDTSIDYLDPDEYETIVERVRSDEKLANRSAIHLIFPVHDNIRKLEQKIKEIIDKPQYLTYEKALTFVKQHIASIYHRYGYMEPDFVSKWITCLMDTLSR